MNIQSFITCCDKIFETVSFVKQYLACITCCCVRQSSAIIQKSDKDVHVPLLTKIICLRYRGKDGCQFASITLFDQSLCHTISIPCRSVDMYYSDITISIKMASLMGKLKHLRDFVSLLLVIK